MVASFHWYSIRMAKRIQLEYW